MSYDFDIENTCNNKDPLLSEIGRWSIQKEPKTFPETRETMLYREAQRDNNVPVDEELILGKTGDPIGRKHYPTQWQKSVIADDGSYIISQYQSKKYGDVQLYFGPLSTSLDQLFYMGWHLEIHAFNHQKFATLRLVNDKKRESFKIAKTYVEDFIKTPDLGIFVKNNKNYLLAKVSEFKKVEMTKIQEEPLDVLKKIYPFKKPNQMVGNLTLPEYVRQQLRSRG